VTFTPDTKEEDGFSASRLFKEWASEDQASSSSEQPPQQVPPSGVKSSKREKKRKKQQPDNVPAGTKDSQQEPSKPITQSDLPVIPEYVHYLQQYHTDKANWKFNKKKQKDVLKNLFNVYRIPPEHKDALVAYISGLQGAGALQRLLEDAEAVLKALLERQGRAEEVEGMESRSARKANYEAALQRELEKLNTVGVGLSEYTRDQIQEMRQEYERGKRAEAVLSVLLTKELAPSTPAHVPASAPTPTPTAPRPTGPRYTKFDDDEDNNTAPIAAAKPTSTPQAKPSKRKRKSRTEVSSSSDSSSSSSSSDSDDD